MQTKIQSILKYVFTDYYNGSLWGFSNIEPLKLIPGNGVYAVKVHTLGKEWRGMCNIGNRPTVGSGNARTVETNIFGFDEDIYGLDIEVTMVRKIRDEVRFGSIDALKEQLVRDRKVCLSYDF